MLLGTSLFAAVLVTSACQLNTQEAVPESAPLKLTGPSENCFGESLKTFEAYFRSEAAPAQIDTAFSCVSGALEMFATYGRGATNRNSFSSQELRAFLERHFLGTLKLNDSILLEFFRVKQSLLGGAIDRLTKTEIDRLQEVLETLRVEVQRLRPYISILNQSQAVGTVDASLLEQALSDFAFSMDTIGTLLGQSKQPYGLESFKTLLVEIQNLYAGRSDWKGPEWISKQLPLLAAAKAVLIRPQGNAIQPDEWHLLFSHVGRIYGLFLRYNYAIKGRDLFYGEALSQIEISILQTSDILEDAIAAKGNGKIEVELLQAFVDELGKGQSFELPIQASTINGLLEPLFERILNPIVIDALIGSKIDPSDRLSAKGYRAVQGGLTSVNLARLRETLLSWVEMQQQWERLERDIVRRNSSLSGKPIPIALVRKYWATYTPHYQESWADLKSLFDRSLPPAVYPDGRLMMVPTKKIVIDRNSFSSLNWKQAIVRALSYGYLSDPEGLRMTGITLPQLKSVFDDFWPLTLDLKFLDPTDVDIWKTGFTIGNIFLFSSNGDDRLSFHEAVDLFMFSFASSVISKETIRPDVYLNCELGDLNAGGNPRVKADCWRGRFRKGYATNFSKMPAWTSMAKGWANGSWDEFFGYLEKASRKSNNPSGPLGTSEMDRPVSIHHYIESLYVRWDSNGDGRLSMAEADKAFYLFREILRKASGFSNNEEVRALYFYLLTFGKAPESFGDKLYWLWWKKTPDEWEKRVSADRLMLTQIFGNLAAQL
jgi:hypothetical protein